MTLRHGRRLGVAMVMAAILVLVSGSAGAAGKVEDISRALLSDPSFKVRTQAAILLGKLGDKAGVDALVKGLEDENKTVRAMSAQSLGKLGTEKASIALKALLGRETEGFVRGQAEKALASIVIPPKPQTADNREKKLYLKFGPFTGGSKAADAPLLGLLRATLRANLEKLSNVMVAEASEEKAVLRSGRPAFIVDGNVLKLDESDVGSGLETSCEVKVMVARWQSRSIILWTSAGAAVQGGRRDRDRDNARRDCIEASANQLADSLIGYFKSQGG